MDDVTLFSLFQELLTGLGASRLILARYELFYKFAHGLISVLIGLFTVINTVIAFTETNELARQILMCLNMLFVSGLLGNFGNRQAATKHQKENVDFVMQSLIRTKDKMGLIQRPPAAIIDSNFAGSPLLLAPMPMAAVNRGSGDLSSLIADPILKNRVTALESLLSAPILHHGNV